MIGQGFIYNIKDDIFGIAVAWKQVKSTTFPRSWRKLWSAVILNQAEDTQTFISQPESTENDRELIAR